MPIINEVVPGSLPGTISSFSPGRGLIAGADGGCYLYRDGRRLLWWALGGGVTGMLNRVARYLPESPAAQQTDEVAIELIDFCAFRVEPTGLQRRGRRALYVLNREVLLQWMPVGLGWLLNGGDFPALSPWSHRPIQLQYELEPPQSAVRPPLPTRTYVHPSDVQLPEGFELTPPPSPPDGLEERWVCVEHPLPPPPPVHGSAGAAAVGGSGGGDG